MAIDITTVRSKFTSLKTGAVFLDNPGGTQVAQECLTRMNAYVTGHNANIGGAFTTSRQSDEVLYDARVAMAEFLNASRPEEIVFGPNMTSLTFNLSRSIAQTWEPGDEIIVTRMDHDANITPWSLAAGDMGCIVKWVDFNPAEGTLDMEGLQEALKGKPKLVAVGYASNALGTINPLKEIIPMAHSAGALVYIDAVQYAPHGPVDVQDLNCDFLVCSSYKFFGPHMGALYGRYELLDKLQAYKVRPAPGDPPGKFETGTQNHEGIAGILGTLEYLEWIGESFGQEYTSRFEPQYSGRALQFKKAMAAIHDYELNLSRTLLEILEETPGVTLYGPSDINRLSERVPTFSFTVLGIPPRQVAVELNEEGIYVWDGNYYALAVTERLGLEESGGMVRVGPVHYNTIDEIHQFREALGRLVS